MDLDALEEQGEEELMAETTDVANSLWDGWEQPAPYVETDTRFLEGRLRERVAALEAEVARLRAIVDVACGYADNGGTIALVELKQAVRDYRAALAGGEGQ